ncbi:cytochrome c [Ruegeria pomeroyi]|uniref:c-type cytochrome n=1 Tax=Ruegeria pomeroyi TaxID=89184 RepID=UPI001F1A2E83|nr:cytochrome c [Ruegeria pomeroyi]MCE8510269.1 cytochrome c [Ruegeria pomeroyi]
MRAIPATALILAVIAACARIDAMPGPAEGEKVFAANCVACHDYRGQGAELSGGGEAPDLTRIAERRDGDFPRAEILTKIDGYGRGKVPSEIMPSFGALLEGELVPVEIDGVMTPTPRPLAALLTYLESIQVSEAG